MDMQQQPAPPAGGDDPKTMLQQAQDLIGKALAAMGAEEGAEGEGGPDQMAAQRADIAKQVFGQ